MQQINLTHNINIKLKKYLMSQFLNFAIIIQDNNDQPLMKNYIQ